MIDRAELKESIKVKNKALKGAIVLKNDCPYTQDECIEDCKADKCNKL